MTNSRFNPQLYKIAAASLQGAIKQAFVPMPQGQMPQPPMDPMAMDPAAQGGAPMDPAMMGAAGGAPPMDPAMAGMDPAMMAGMDPAAMGAGAGAPPAEATPPPAPEGGGGGGGTPDIKGAIREELTAAGVIKAPKLKDTDYLAWIQDTLTVICNKLGVQAPPMPQPEAPGGKDGAGGAKPAAGASPAPASGGGTTKTSGAAIGPGMSGQPSSKSLTSGSEKKSSSALLAAMNSLRN